jgi:hypothetical protein
MAPTRSFDQFGSNGLRNYDRCEAAAVDSTQKFNKFWRSGARRGDFPARSKPKASLPDLAPGMWRPVAPFHARKDDDAERNSMRGRIPQKTIWTEYSISGRQWNIRANGLHLAWTAAQ